MNSPEVGKGKPLFTTDGSVNLCEHDGDFSEVIADWRPKDIKTSHILSIHVCSSIPSSLDAYQISRERKTWYKHTVGFIQL